MSVGAWFVMILLTMIPVVNIILILIWAFGGSENRNKQNLWRAYLLFMLLIVGLVLVLSLVVAVAGGLLAMGA